MTERDQPAAQPPADANPPNTERSSVLERHYKLSEIAEAWNISEDTARKMFLHEPGVLTLGEGSRLVGGGKYKRRYYHLRVPESVLQRVKDRLVHKRPPSDAAVEIDRGRSRGKRGERHVC